MPRMMAFSQPRITSAPSLDRLLLGLVGGAALLTTVVLEGPLLRPVAAQVESFLLGPGSSVGPETKVEPKNCVTAADGSITCDTQLQNSPSDTQAKPQYSPWRN
jgi:hypothetical protein